MAIFELWAGTKEQTDSMAARKSTAEIDSKLATAYSESLAEAGTSREAFEQIIERLKKDRSLGPAETVIVAQNFGIAGKKLTTKTAAIAAIEKRFVEIVRFHKKNRVAAGTRPW